MKCYTITKSMRALWLVNQLWFIAPVNPRKNRASFEYVGTTSRVFKSKISRHGVTFWNSWLIDLIFIEYRVAHCHVSLRTVLETGSDFRKMKSRARFSWYRVSGSDFVKAFKSRSRIFKQGSRRLGESRILPFTTPHWLAIDYKWQPAFVS